LEGGRGVIRSPYSTSDILSKENELATLKETNTQNEIKISELKQEISKYKSDVEHHNKIEKEKRVILVLSMNPS